MMIHTLSSCCMHVSATVKVSSYCDIIDSGSLNVASRQQVIHRVMGW